MYRALRKLAAKWTGRSAHVAGPGTVLEPSVVIGNPLRDRDRIRIGSNCVIQGQLALFGHGGRISIGDWCFLGQNTRIWSGVSVEIGDRVLISHDVNIFDNDTHPFDAVARHRQFVEMTRAGHPKVIDLQDQPVRIGDDAWIGAKAIILKGVTVGKGAVVAAGAIVTRDVPAYAVVAGNPARVIREMTPTEVSS
jgi:acetyltransferase-like isoleucine patch superfamily enzyme